MILNIISHDVIHDYRNSGDNRWFQIKAIFDVFVGLASSSSVSGGDGVVVQQPQQPPLSFQPIPEQITPQMGTIGTTEPITQPVNVESTMSLIEKLSDSQYNVEISLQKFISTIKCDIIMNMFVLSRNTDYRMSLDDIINYIMLIPIIFSNKVEDENSRIILYYIYSDISELLYGWMQEKKYSITDYNSFLDIFNEFTKVYNDEIETIIWSYYQKQVKDAEPAEIQQIINELAAVEQAEIDRAADEQAAAEQAKIEWAAAAQARQEQIAEARAQNEEFERLVADYNERQKNSSYVPDNSIGKRKRESQEESRGGGREKLSGVNASNLVNSIEIILGRRQLSYDSDLFTIKTDYEAKIGLLTEYFKKGNITEFNKVRNDLIQILGGIYVFYNAGQYKDALNRIPVLTPRGSRITNIKTEIEKVIESSIQVPLKLSENYEKANMANMARMAKDAIKTQSGEMNKEDRDMVNQFMKLIARIGLMLTNVVTQDGSVNEVKDPTLQQQINILAYIANNNSANKDANGVSRITSAELDNNLEEYYTTLLHNGGLRNSQEISGKAIICKNTNKYIVDNATTRGSLQRWSFCPYSSIIDGMKKCTWNIATNSGNIERGNMDFMICDITQQSKPPKIFYQGKMTLESPQSSIIDMEFNIQLPNNVNINGKKLRIDISSPNDSSLEASFVLGDTLKSINDLDWTNKDMTDGIIQAIERNLFTLFDDPQSVSGQKIPLYAIILRKILFKGVGDLFQEINAVAKHGGYTKETYECSPLVEQYDTYGNAIRFFAANDRPSGTRFMFMLENGDIKEINQKAFGGYYSNDDSKELLTHRKGNNDLCKLSQLPVQAGGRKHHTRKLKSKTHKRRARKNHTGKPKRQTKRPVKRLPNRSRKARKPLKTK